MSGTRVSFSNKEPSVISILPIEESVGSDEEDDELWYEEEEEKMPEEDYEQQRAQESIRKKKLAKPPPFQLLRWQQQNKNEVIRSEIYEELRQYEAQRRTTFSAKLEATQLYFKSLMDLLQNSFDETAKIYRLALGTSIAQSQYARAITQRGTHQVPRDSSPSAALLHSWQEANTILAATLEESAVDIEENVVSVISTFQDALQDQKNQFETIGKPILEELEHMEGQVQKTWDAYWRTASKNMEPGSASLPFRNSVEFEQKEEDHVPAEDLWIVEMQYKISVSVQRATWEKRGPEIVRLASSSKEMEVTRRIKLNESMVQFLTCLKKLFKTIGEDSDVRPIAANALMKPLESIHNDIEEKVKSQVEASLPEEFKLSFPDDSAAGFGLECDGLVLAARVMEWKNTYSPMSVADRWRTALAVITADQYLHLFDMDPYCHTAVKDSGDPKVYPGCDPSVAMELLFPFFSKENEGAKKKPADGIRDKMVPERTLRLSKHCGIQHLSDECCELVQKTPSKARLLGGKKPKPVYKAQLRILSSDAGSEDKEQFFALLKQCVKN